MRKKFRGYPPPGEGPHTQVPNEFFDIDMAGMGLADMKVFMAILRQTFGWHKIKDAISISQLREKTGLGRRAILRGIQKLDELGIVSVVRTQDTSFGNLTNVYTVTLIGSAGAAVDPRQARQMGAAVDDLFDDED